MSKSGSGWTAVQLHPRDNVICLLRAHDAGERPAAQNVQTPALTSDVPSGHKIALSEILEGELVFKYGHPIGRATRGIAPGDHVHLHNLVGLAVENGG